MKAISLASRILAVALSVAVVVLLFFGIVHITSAQGTFELSATQLAFGSKISDSVDMNKSAWFFFTLVTAVIGAICAVASFKTKKAAVGQLVFGVIDMIMMLLFICNTPGTYVDYRPLTGINGRIWYNSTFIVLLCVSIAAVVLTIASILLADYVAVKESNGAKKVLFVRFKAWLLEYKSEIKKTNWPNFKTVVKNTGIVLVMCLVVGIVIWLADLGLSALMKLIFKA